MDPEFIAKLQAAFKEEASEHLQSIGAACLALEKEPGAGDQIEKLLMSEEFSSASELSVGKIST